MAVPSNLTVVKRRLGNVVYVPGVRMTLDIGRDAVLVALKLHLKYTVSTGATAPVGALFNQAIRLLKRIELVANGKDTPINVQGQYLLSRVITEHQGSLPQGFENTINMAANQVSNMDIVLPLRLDSVMGRRQDDMGIDCTKLTQLTLAITWGLITDLFTTPGATVAISNASLSVEGEYLQNATTKKDMNPSSKTYGQMVPKVYLARELSEISQPITGTQTNLTTILDTGSGALLKSILMATVTGEIADDTLVYNNNGNLQLDSGAWTFYNRESVVARSDLRSAPYYMAPAEIQAGVFMLNDLYAGQIVSAIDTSQLDSNLTHLADVTYTAGNSAIWYQLEKARPLRV